MMRSLLPALLAAVLFAACLPEQADLTGKSCNAAEGCADGFTCVRGHCLAAGEECTGDETVPCGSSVGACKPGVRRCQADHTLGGACEGEVGPADEACNGVDDNCDGRVDEGLTQACPLQAGVCAGALTTCADGVFGGCGAASYGPSWEAAETRCDGLDNDCDGQVDEGLDDDHDGYGKAGVSGCPKAGVDCDDTSAAVNPGATEACNAADDNCNAAIDEGLDDDRDGYGAAGVSGCPNAGVDCDDKDAQVHPGVAEACNGKDDNCDGKKDEGLDDDNDGYGKSGVTGCPSAGVDCDDAVATIHPGAPESCNGLDDDCDGSRDEGLDDDNDGYGKAGVSGCANAGVDCDDTKATVHPGATEACNGADDNCDGKKDEGLDDDNDGYGKAGVSGCPKAGVDCDDASASVNPGASEVCNGLDDNCSGLPDETFACVASSSGGTCSYTGAVCTTTGSQRCSASCGVLCDAPPERCNGRDDDCDGSVDEGLAGAPANVSSSTTASTGPSVMGDASGGFVASWSESEAAGGERVALRRLDATGAPVGTVSFATVASTGATLPSAGRGFLTWLQPRGQGKRVMAAPVTVGATSATATAGTSITNNAATPLTGSAPLVGLQGASVAVGWLDNRVATVTAYVQAIDATGAAVGGELAAGPGTAFGFFTSEETSPARTGVVTLTGGKAVLRTFNAGAYATSATLGTNAVDVAGGGTAAAWIERGTNDSVVVYRANASKAQGTVYTHTGTGLANLALAPVTADTWLVTFTRPRAGGGTEVVAARATWLSTGWTIGTPTAVEAGVTTLAPAAGGDGSNGAVAYVKGSDVFSLVTCP